MWFLIYILSSGIIMYYIVQDMLKKMETRQFKNEKDEQNIIEIEQLIFENFGTSFNLFIPTLNMLALTLGWILIPLAFINKLLELFGIELFKP